MLKIDCKKVNCQSLESYTPRSTLLWDADRNTATAWCGNPFGHYNDPRVFRWWRRTSYFKMTPRVALSVQTAAPQSHWENWIPEANVSSQQLTEQRGRMNHTYFTTLKWTIEVASTSRVDPNCYKEKAFAQTLYGELARGDPRRTKWHHQEQISTHHDV